ncbi:MAG: hypothetical protein JXR10_13890 [Cyclobacteriaceae bacterium]
MKSFINVIWICLVGFMLAWHNVFYSKEDLREDYKIKIEQIQESVEKEDAELNLMDYKGKI